MLELSIVVKATVVFALALSGTHLARKARASVRHLWCASAFGAMLMLPLATVVMPRVNLEIPIARVNSLASLSPVGQDARVDYTPSDATGAIHQSNVVTGERRSVSGLTLLRAGWALGATLFLAPLFAALWRLRRIRRSGLPWLQGEVLIRQLAVEAGVRRSVEILLHEEIVAPMTCGFARPAIVLPVDAPHWNDADVRRAVVHELEHVHRADWPVHVGARVVCALYWFHPLAWTLWRHLCLESERACDDAVLRRADRTAYAEQLVTLARRLLGNDSQPVLSMANRSDLSARVSAVLDASQLRGRAGARWATVTVAAAVVAVVSISPLAAVGPARGPRAVAQSWAADGRQPSFEAASKGSTDVIIVDRTVRPPDDHGRRVVQPLSPQPEPSANVQSISGNPAVSPKSIAQVTAVPAQSPTADSGGPVFDVASVKRNKSGDRRTELGFQQGGRFKAINETLWRLMGEAYATAQALPRFQIVGGPSWIDSDRFDIDARPEGGATTEQRRLMLRALLADRFKLVVHQETQELPIYNLVRARTDGKLGEQLHPSDVDCAALRAAGSAPAPVPPGQPRPCVMGFGRGVLSAKAMTMSQFAGMGLSRYVERVVVDRTGIEGGFDWTLTWTPDQLRDLRPSTDLPPGTLPQLNGSPFDTNGPSIFTALQEQLGLKLESAKGPVPILVIDRAEQPTPD